MYVEHPFHGVFWVMKGHEVGTHKPSPVVRSELLDNGWRVLYTESFWSVPGWERKLSGWRRESGFF